MDLIFVDIKHMDSKLHQLLTGKDNQRILENVKRLEKLNKEMVIRIPVIHGVNAYNDNIKKTFLFIKEYVPRASVELLPYHIWGLDKYKQLNLPFPDQLYQECINNRKDGFVSDRLETPPLAEMEFYSQMARSYGLEIISYR